MTNVDKLEQLGILGEVRQRLGSGDEGNDSCDSDINGMTNHDLVKHWCGWRLGYDSWWTSMKGYFDALEELNNKDHLEIFEKEEMKDND